MSTHRTPAISRRNFHCQILSAAAAGLAGGAPPAGKYADCHVHLTQAWATRPQLTRQQLLKWMDARQVAQAHRGSIRWQRLDNMTSFSIEIPLLSRDADHGSPADC